MVMGVLRGYSITKQLDFMHLFGQMRRLPAPNSASISIPKIFSAWPLLLSCTSSAIYQFMKKRRSIFFL
jgi:hypothetical protein